MKDLLRWMLMMLFYVAQGIVPYIQPKSYQSCYALLRFKRSLPDRCQASVAGAAIPARASRRDCMMATPG